MKLSKNIHYRGMSENQQTTEMHSSIFGSLQNFKKKVNSQRTASKSFPFPFAIPTTKRSTRQRAPSNRSIASRSFFARSLARPKRCGILDETILRF